MDIKVRWADNTKELASNLKSGADQIEATKAAAEKMAQALQGDKLIQAAHNMAAAIQQVGGTTTLTASQMELANALFEKAAEKLQLTGQGGTYAAQTFRELASQTESADVKMERLAANLRQMGPALTTVGAGLTAGITAPLVAFGTFSIKSAMDFETAFSGVKKTVSGTPAELQAINDQFREMAKVTPVAAVDLAHIGEMAGQLGVSKERIVEFTKTIVDISTATNLTADEAGSAFARLANVMKMPQEQFANLGSAVVALGNFGASTEQEMLSMAQRISAAGATAGMTAPQVLGIANALSSVGIEAEAGGTAVSRVINKIASDVASGGGKLQTFAKIAGLSAQEFRKAWHDDAGEAFTQFMQGLANARERGGDELLGLMDELGFKEVRLRNAFMAAANAGTLMADSIHLGTKAFAENTELTRAAGERYETAANQLKVLWNNVTDVAITVGNTLTPTMVDSLKALLPMVKGADELAKKFADLPEPIRLGSLAIVGVGAAAGPSIFILGQLANSITNLLPLLDRLSKVGMFSGIASMSGMGVLGAIAAGAAAVAVEIHEAYVGIANSEEDYKNRSRASSIALAQQKLDEAGINKKLTSSMEDLALAYSINEHGAAAAMQATAGLSDEHKKGAAGASQLGAALETVAQKVAALTEAEKADILTKRAQHESIAAIAKETGIATDVVSAFIAQQKDGAGKAKKAYEDWQRAVSDLEDQFEGMNWDYTIDGALKLGGSINEIAAYFGVSRGEVRNHQEALKVWAAVVKLEATAAAKGLTSELEHLGRTISPKEMDEFNVVLAKMAKLEAEAASTTLPASLETIGQKFKYEVNPELEHAIKLHEQHLKMLDQLASGFQQLAQIAGGSFGEIASAIGRAVSVTATIAHQIDAFNKAKVEKDKAGQAQAAVGMGLQGVGGVEQIAQGGAVNAASGGLAVGAAGAGLLASAGVISGMAALSVATLGIGAAAIGAYYGIKALMSIGGPSDEEISARKTQVDLVKALGDQATVAQQKQIALVAEANHGSTTYATFAIVGRDAMLKIGKSAAEADQVVQGLLDTHNPQRFAAAMKQVQDAINLDTKAQNALNDALSRYHFTTEQLGPAMRAQKLDEQAQQLYQDWQVLNAAGIDNAAISKQMSANVNDYLQMALKTGTEVPIAMKPMLEQMADMGDLTDAAGNKLSKADVDGMNFSTTMTQGFKDIVQSVKDLTDVIARGLGVAIDGVTDKINKIPRDITVNVGVNRTDTGGGGEAPPEDPYTPHMATGVRGFAGGWAMVGEQGPELLRLPSGSDVIPHGIIPSDFGLSSPMPSMSGNDWQGLTGGTVLNDAGQPIVLDLTVQSLLDGQVVAENTVRRVVQNKRGVGTVLKRGLPA
jgi:TP901 family phage tail tape measure protein